MASCAGSWGPETFFTVASQDLGGVVSGGEEDMVLRRREDVNAMAETVPSSREGQEGLYGGMMRGGSVRRTRVRLRLCSISAVFWVFASVSVATS